MKGSQISEIRTGKSWYDNDCLDVYIKGRLYKLKVNEVLRMANEFVFKTRKAIKHTYLEVSRKEN